jgi:GWxTD domain-containing protein
MSVRRTLLTVLALVWSLPAAAEKLDKESKKWLDEVTSIMVPEERQTYTSLKDRSERAEFEKIFWARRDPNPETPENEYETEWRGRRADADKRFRVGARPGSQTDCGRVLILLGEPDRVRKEEHGENPSLRSPETWMYKDKATITFKGGQVEIALDSECQLGNPAAAKQLDLLAGATIVSPNLTYKIQGGKLTPLADLLPKPSPAQTLLKTPRQDFPLKAKLSFLKVEDGSTAILGLVRVDAASVTADGKQAKVTVCAEARNAEGRSVAFVDRAVLGRVAADGSVTASYKMVVKPGKYEVKSCLVDDKSGKGSLISEPTDAPDFDKHELTAASLLVLADIRETTSVEPNDPDEGFFIGKAQLVPRFGPVFTTAEAPLFFYQGYDGQVDPATSKASVTIALTLAKGSKDVAKAPEQTMDSSLVGGAVGPVPLSTFEPGTYTAKLKLRDNVAKKDLNIESAFEVVAAPK